MGTYVSVSDKVNHDKKKKEEVFIKLYVEARHFT